MAMNITQETHPLHDNPAQVVSRARVAGYGEVYTALREVNAMLDLVKQETCLAW